MVLLALALTVAAVAQGGTYGKVVYLRGQISDIALDERRGLLYAANFTANRIEQIRTDTGATQNAVMVGEMPGSLALSADGRYLVAGHFGGGVTVMDLALNQTRTIAMPAEVLAVAFGAGYKALIVTRTGFYLLEPYSATTMVLPVQLPGSVGPMPAPPGARSPDLVRASAGVSGDGMVIYVAADMEDKSSSAPGGGSGETDATTGSLSSLLVRFQVANTMISVQGFVSSPPFGPRQVSVNENGSAVIDGWALLNTVPRLVLKAQIPNSTGKYSEGGHVFDSRRNVVYMQAPTTPPDGKAVVKQEPLLHVMNPENLAVMEVLRLPAALGGKALLSTDKSTMYAISQNGVLIIPLDTMSQAPRVVADQEAMLFAANSCDKHVLRQTLRLDDPSGRGSDFKIAIPAGTKGLRVYPLQGSTPAEVTVEVDPSAYLPQNGTTVVPLTIASTAGVNVTDPVMVKVSSRDPDQKGRILNVPGRLVDVLADPVRPRIYVLRQDRNQLLVFDAQTFAPVAIVPTGNTPTQMTITADAKYMIVGATNSQIAHVVDLDNLTLTAPVEMPFGQYPRSVAATANAILSASRSAGGPPGIYRLDLATRSAAAPARLGMFQNKLKEGSMLAANWRGLTAMLASPDGSVMLYEAASDTFVAGRKDFDELGGAIAVLTDDWFVAGNNLLDRALYPYASSLSGEAVGGAALYAQDAFYRTVTPQHAPAYIERVQGWEGPMSRMARLAEPPLAPLNAGTPIGLTGTEAQTFIRSLTVVPSTQAVVSLTTSGLTVLESDYDSALMMPQVSGITNAADRSGSVAPGGLIAISGSGLAPGVSAAGMAPWPTTLGDVCVQANGVALPLSRVAPDEIVAQLTYDLAGSALISVRTANGVSGTYQLAVSETAPAIFRAEGATAGADSPVIVRWKNSQAISFSNPIHGDDNISIYLTGMGRLLPEPEPGAGAPSNPPATLVSPVKVVLGSEVLPLWWSGAQAGEVGVYRIDARVPWWVKSGNEVPLSIVQGGVQTIVPVRVVAK